LSVAARRSRAAFAYVVCLVWRGHSCPRPLTLLLFLFFTGAREPPFSSPCQISSLAWPVSSSAGRGPRRLRAFAGGLRIRDSRLACEISLALVRVELPLNRRLRAPAVGVACELRVTSFADSAHRSVPYSLHDPEISLWHGFQSSSTLWRFLLRCSRTAAAANLLQPSTGLRVGIISFLIQGIQTRLAQSLGEVALLVGKSDELPAGPATIVKISRPAVPFLGGSRNFAHEALYALGTRALAMSRTASAFFASTAASPNSCPSSTRSAGAATQNISHPA